MECINSTRIELVYSACNVCKARVSFLASSSAGEIPLKFSIPFVVILAFDRSWILRLIVQHIWAFISTFASSLFLLPSNRLPKQSCQSHPSERTYYEAKSSIRLLFANADMSITRGHTAYGSKCAHRGSLHICRDKACIPRRMYKKTIAYWNVKNQCIHAFVSSSSWHCKKILRSRRTNRVLGITIEAYDEDFGYHDWEERSEFWVSRSRITLRVSVWMNIEFFWLIHLILQVLHAVDAGARLQDQSRNVSWGMATTVNLVMHAVDVKALVLYCCSIHCVHLQKRLECCSKQVNTLPFPSIFVSNFCESFCFDPKGYFFPGFGLCELLRPSLEEYLDYELYFKSINRALCLKPEEKSSRCFARKEDEESLRYERRSARSGSLC